MTTATDWTGRVGDVWAAEWRRTDRSFADLSRHLDAAIQAAAPDGPFRAFDIGCGAGGTSLSLAAARPDARIIGADLSAPLVSVANDRRSAMVPPQTREPSAAGSLRHDAEHPAARNPRQAPNRAPAEAGAQGGERRSPSYRSAPGPRLSGNTTDWRHRAETAAEFNAEPQQGEGAHAVTFLAGDALDLASAHAPFDLLYSRHGVMFFDDPIAAFTTLRRAAAPGARLVFSCFRAWEENAFAVAPARALGLAPPASEPGPFAFADRDHVAAILSAAGWREACATPIDFAYRAGAGAEPIDDALGLLQRIGPAAAALRSQSDGDRVASIDRLRGVIERYRSGDAVDFPAAAWIWSATA